MEAKQQYVIFYRRVSTKKQETQGGSLDEQLQQLRQQALSHGFEVLDGEGYKDVYSGGRSFKGRKNLLQAIDRINELSKQGKHVKLMVLKADRIGRDLFESLEILKTINDEIFFCDFPHADRMMIVMALTFAERELKLIKGRGQATKDRIYRAIDNDDEYQTTSNNAVNKKINHLGYKGVKEQSARGVEANKAKANQAASEIFEGIKETIDTYGFVNFQAIADSLNFKGIKPEVRRKRVWERDAAGNIVTKEVRRTVRGKDEMQTKTVKVQAKDPDFGFLLWEEKETDWTAESIRKRIYDISRSDYLDAEKRDYLANIKTRKQKIRATKRANAKNEKELKAKHKQFVKTEQHSKLISLPALNGITELSFKSFKDILKNCESPFYKEPYELISEAVAV